MHRRDANLPPNLMLPRKLAAAVPRGLHLSTATASGRVLGLTNRIQAGHSLCRPPLLHCRTTGPPRPHLALAAAALVGMAVAGASRSRAALSSPSSPPASLPLLAPAYAGDVAAVTRLLSAPAKESDLNATDGDGYTALLVAAMAGHAKVVLMLLESGAHPSLALPTGETALHLAAANGHADVVALLLQEANIAVGTTDVDATNGSGSTALHMSAANDHADVVEMLVRAGAGLEGRDGNGETPLSLAAKFKHRALVALLLQLGAKLEKGNSYSGMRWGNVNTGGP